MRSTGPTSSPSDRDATASSRPAHDRAGSVAGPHGFATSVIDRRIDNGARILIIPTSPAGQTVGDGRGPVALELWVMAGTSAEGPDEHGCAHLLEHMLFKPTPAGKGGRRVDIASAIETLGGDVNAFTSHDETVFHATVPAAAVPEAMGALVAPVLHPQIDPAELRREIGVVVEEIKQYDDDPASTVYQDLMELVYGDHSYSRPVLGRAPEVRRHGERRLGSFHRSTYTADRMVLVVVGPVDPDSTLALAQSLLRELPARGRVLRPEHLNRPRRPRVRLRASDVAEVQLALGWVGPTFPHPDACALEVAALVLGYGDASRLEAQTRRTSKRVTDAHATLYTSRHSSTFCVSANVAAGGLDKAVEALLEQLDILRRVPMEEEELRRARAVLQSDLIYRRETVQGLSHAVGNQLSLSGDLEAEQRYYDALDSVHADAVREACERYLDPAQTCLSAVVPRSDAKRKALPKLRSAVAKRLRSGVTRRRTRRTVRTTKGIVTTELEGGLRIRVIPDRSVPMAAGWLVWPGGQRLEAARDAGASALAAELLTRGCAAVDGDTLAREIDGTAAVLEGFSGRNTLGMHFECLSANLTHVLRRALECARAPSFLATELDEERRVALEDLEAEDDDLASVAFREAFARLYRRHAFGRRRRGSKAALQRVTSKRLGDLWRAGYPLGRATLGICGDVDVDAVIGLCQALADDLPRPEGPQELPGQGPQYPRRAVTNRIRRRREQAHFVMAWPGLHVDDSRIYALDVLSAVLGGQAGRLFDALREKEGLVYHVSVSSTEGLDAGHIAIYGAASPAKLETSLTAVRRELHRLATEATPVDEFERAKAWVIGQHEVEMQRRSRVASQLAFDEALGLRLGSFRSYPARIGRVKAKAVRDLCRDLFDPHRVVTSIVGG